MKFSVGVFVLSFLIVGCGGPESFRASRWSKSSNSAPELPLNTGAIKAQVEVQNIGDSRVLRTRQTVQGISLEQTWYQEVYSPKNELESFTYQLASDVDADAVQQAKQLEQQMISTLKLARRLNPDLRKSPEINHKEVVLVREAFRWAPYLKVSFVAPSEDKVLVYYLNEGGRLRRVIEHQHQFTNGVGFVFHSSPVDSDLSSQVLSNLKGDGTLSSPHLSVESALEPTPYSPDNVFKIETQDREFDLLQAYFFVDQTMQWFQEQLQVALGNPLNIKVHVGGMKATNAAFFYAGNIRLGEGDGILYKGIPRDPSIVTHEASHAYVEYLSGLGFEDEPGVYSEAFADFFTAARLGRPEMGFYSYLKEPFKRTIDNSLLANRDLHGKKYGDSLVVSGTFWELKKILGTEKSVQLAKHFLIELGPGGRLQDFPEVLTSVTRQHLPSEDWHVVESVLEQRGWR
jgi:hypothetical protein